MSGASHTKGYAATQNGCKLCAPLGACLAIRGLEKAVPFLHGSQGCATYIRRYLISHFREPVDIASSSFDETTAVFGGERNLLRGIENVYDKYHPDLIGIATTCLAETMGEDVGLYLSSTEAKKIEGSRARLFHVSTPSYSGTHAEGFWETVRSLAATFAKPGPRGEHVTLFPGMLSPADYRYLKGFIGDFGVRGHVIPDYSDTLDGPIWSEYQPIPRGGTPFSQLEQMGSAAATLELSDLLKPEKSPGRYLESRYGVPCTAMSLPIGIRATDRLADRLSALTGRPCPEPHVSERLRLIDAYVDGHKHVSGAKAVVYGELDLVVGLAGFLAEVGIRPVLCASGASSARLGAALESVIEDDDYYPEVVEQDVDFVQIETIAADLRPDIIVGNSKGYGMSRRLRIPLVRTGFPIHDRFGGQRLRHVGYRGATELFDRIVNALVEAKQDQNPVGYMYM